MDTYSRFLSRLVTYEGAKWSDLSITAASPLLCARYGWKNIAVNTIQCVTCDAVLRCNAWSLWNVGGPDDDEYIKSLLLQRHQDHCIWRTMQSPENYMHLQLHSLVTVSRELMKRFDGFHLLWDLPNMKRTLPKEQEGFDCLRDFVYERLLKRLDQRIVERYRDELKERVVLQMWLALLGWELQWEDTFIYADNNDLYSTQFTRGHANDPNQTDICFGRQARVQCGLCTGRRSLWRTETFADISCSEFVSMTKSLRDSKQSQLLSGVKRLRHEWLQEANAKSSKSITEFKRPPFGMHAFAKTKASEMNYLLASKSKMMSSVSKEGDQQDVFEDAYPVLSPHQFDPVSSHRYFCPFRHEWKQLLKALTEG